MFKSRIPTRYHQWVMAVTCLSFLVLLASALAGCGGQQSAAPPALAAPAQAASAPAEPRATATPVLPHAPTEPPAAQAVQVDVANYAIYPYGGTGLQIIGEVVNRGSEPVSDVQVTMALLDAGGKELASGTAMINPRLAPGGKFPFRISMETAPKEAWKNVRIQTNGRPASPGQASQDYWDLKAEGVTVGVNPSKRVVVTGMLKNVGAQTAQLSVPIVAYDAAGKLIDLASAYTTRVLPPGAESAFTATFEHLSVPPARFEVIGFGMTMPGEAPGAPAAPALEIVSSAVRADPAPGAFEMVGLVANRGKNPVTEITVRATLLDAGGKVLATGENTVGLGHLPPGAQWPFLVSFTAPEAKHQDVRLEATGRTPGPGEASPITYAFEVSGIKANVDAFRNPGVLGVVRNLGDGEAEGTMFWAVALDAAGKPLDIASGALETQRLAPGASSPFELRFRGLSAQPARYTVFVVGRPVATIATVRAEAGLLSLTPTPVGAPRVEVASYSAYRDDAARRLELFGEVANNGDAPAGRIKVVATLLDAGRKLVGTESRAFQYLEPGGRAPFEMLVDIPGGYETLLVTAEGEAATGGPPAETYTGLTITRSRVEQDQPAPNEWWSVTGRMKNTGGQAAKGVILSGIARDAAGKVLEVARARADILDALPPGVEWPFRLGFTHLKAKPDRVDVVAEGNLVNPPTPTVTPTPTALPTPTPTPAPTDTPADVRVEDYRQYTGSDGRIVVVGMVKNAGQGPVRNVAVTLTLLDDSGRAVSTGVTQVPYPIANGQTLPFRLVVDQATRGSKQVVLTATGERATEGQAESVCMDALPKMSSLSPNQPAGGLVDTATLKNTCGRPIRDLQILLVAQDANEKVLDVAIGYTEPRDLAPGAEASYKLIFEGLPVFPEGAEVTIESRGWYADGASVAPAAVAQAAATPTETPTPASVRVEAAEPTFTPVPSPTLTPTPEVKLAVVSSRTYDNGVSWVGEVENRGKVPTESWTVAVTVLDAKGVPLLVLNTPNWGYRLNPGEKLPFSVSKNQGSGYTWMLSGFASARADVQGEPADSASDEYRELKVEGLTAGRATFPDRPTLRGTARNTGNRPVESIHVFATAYDKQGQVVDVAEGVFNDTRLAPGASAPFEVSFYNLKDARLDYRVVARARLADEFDLAPMPGPTPTEAATPEVSVVTIDTLPPAAALPAAPTAAPISGGPTAAPTEALPVAPTAAPITAGPTATPTEALPVAPTAAPIAAGPTATPTEALPVEPTAAGQTATAAPYPTPDPNAPVRVASYTLRGVGTDSLTVYGELLNTTDQPLRRAIVEVALLDASGRDIYNRTEDIYGCAPAAGGRCPFELSLDGVPKTGWEQVAMEVFSEPAQPGQFVLNGYRELALRGIGATELLTNGKKGGWVLGGWVANTGSKTVNVDYVRIALYDPNGRVVLTGEVRPALTRLAPGQETAFQFEFHGLAAPPQNYLIVPVGTEE